MKNKLPLLFLALSALAITCAITLEIIPAAVAAGGLVCAFGFGFPLLEPAKDPAAGDEGGKAGTEPAEPLTIGQQLRAALSAKATLVAKIDEQRGALADMTKQLEAGETDLAAARAEIVKLKEKITELEAAKEKASTEIKDAKAESSRLTTEAKTAGQLADEKLDALGFPARELPKADADKTGDTADELLAAAEKETDPKKKGILAAQAWEASFPSAPKLGKN